MLKGTNIMLSLTSASIATVLTQSSPTFGSDPFVERLGVAGMLVLAAFFMLRYFMGVVEKKDEQINELVKRQQEKLEENSQALIQHIQLGYNVQQKTTDALYELTNAIRQGKFVK